MIALYTLLAIWLLGWLVLPIGRYVDDLDSNGKNWPGFFVVNRGLPYEGKPVWAQEYYEAQLKWRIFPLLSGLLIAIGRIIPALAVFERRMELMGHEVEVQVEARLGGDEEAARLREARALANRYTAFKGWSVERAEEALRERQGKAMSWVLDNRKAWDAKDN